VKTLARYLEIIVDPTFHDFHDNRGSVRHAYLETAKNLDSVGGMRRMTLMLR
jgi:hypothetical protein